MTGHSRENPPYWPGGIPEHIQCHPHPIPPSEVGDEVKGWLLFVDENVLTRPGDQPDDGEFELFHRRELVSRWASMDQTARDAYQSRAEPRLRWTPPSGLYHGSRSWEDKTLLSPRVVNCLVRQPMASRSRAVWTKFRILLYQLEGEDGPLINDGEATICIPNPASGPGGCVNPNQEFLMWSCVENADFHRMYMTSKGTVISPWIDNSGPFILVDQESLDTGLLLLCEFHNNGELGVHHRIRHWILYRIWNLIDPCVLGKRIKDVMESYMPRSINPPVDMDQPILDILESCKPYIQGGIDEWMDDIERYAPGYLNMEDAGQGLALEYDCTRLRNMEELQNIPREEFDNTEA